MEFDIILIETGIIGCIISILKRGESLIIVLRAERVYMMLLAISLKIRLLQFFITTSSVSKDGLFTRVIFVAHETTRTNHKIVSIIINVI